MNETNMNYFRNARPAVATHIPRGANRVLDVGCGSGLFGASLKQSGQAAVVHGVEFSEAAAREAARHVDKVECGDLDVLDVAALHRKWGSSHYDFIVFSDVLEHVKDPWAVLHDFMPLLDPNGTVIISVPNVRHWSVLVPLLVSGRWDYKDAGIMDRTHLRFFTRATAHELLETAGLQAVRVQAQIGGKWRHLSRATLRLFDEFLAIQFVFVATRKG